MNVKAMSSAAGATGGYVTEANKADDHADDAMIAFMLDASLADQLLTLARHAGIPEEGLQTADQMHLTLAYLGKVADAPGSDEENVTAELEKFASGWGSIKGAINGVGRFIDNPDKDCIYLNFDSPELPRFRQALVAFLKGIDVDPAENHGYTPHITLAYIGKDDPMPTITLQSIEVAFDALTLMWGNQPYEVSLNSADNAQDGEEEPLPEEATEEILDDADDLPDGEALKRKKPHDEMLTNVTDQMNDPAYNAGEMSDDQHFAYPEESKLPMPDAQHVLLAAAALGPKPPHGHKVDIPHDKVDEVKGRIRARGTALGLGKEEMAKVNAYLSGNMPASVSEKDAGTWASVYSQALDETGDEIKATLAAQGAINRQAMIGRKSVNGLPTSVAGWAMLFSDPDDLDLQGTFFNDATRTLVEYYPNAPLWMEHGKDPVYGGVPIGWRTFVQVFPHGIWMEHELDTEHPLYARTAQDVLDGKFAYSSDSLAHYAVEGYDPDSGYLSEWPLAGCSLTRSPAEPGLGPVLAKDFEMALKSVALRREAASTTDGASPQTEDKEEKQMLPPNPVGEETANPATAEAVPTSPLDALASMYGCSADPAAVRSAMDSHIQQMQTEGKAAPELCKALGLPEDSPAEAVAGHLNNLYSAAMSTKDDMPTDADAAPEPEPTMSVPAGPNYGALRSFMDSSAAAKSASRPLPRLTGAMAAKGINIGKSLPVPGVAELVVDMIRMRNGMGPKHAFNSAKAMNSATGPTGGYVLRQEISEDILDPLRSEPVVIKLGAQQEDMQGMQVKQVPAMQSAPSGNWIGENVAVTQTQPSYRMISLVPHGYQVTVPIPVNVEANMTPKAEKQLRQQIILTQTLAIDYAAMLGNGGGGMPVGILYSPGVRQMLLAANGRVPTFTDIVNANGLLDDSNVPQEGAKRGMAFHSKIERAFTGQTDSLGRPLLRESWAQGPEKDIAGFPYQVSTQIPTNVVQGTSSVTSFVFFSDWRYLIVGLSDMVELRLDQTFMQNLQVGLLAYIYADIKVAYPEAFIAMTGAKGADIAGVSVTTNATT